MLKRVLGSFVVLVAIAAITGCEQGPTEVNAPEFKAAQGDMSEYTAIDLGAQDGLWGPIPCMGEGDWSFVGTHYILWVKDVVTPSGNIKSSGYIDDINENNGSSLVNGNGDTWYLYSFEAPVVLHTFDQDGRQLIHEEAVSIYVNDAGEVRRLHDSIHTVKEDGVKVQRWVERCQAIGGVPRR